MQFMFSKAALRDNVKAFPDSGFMNTTFTFSMIATSFEKQSYNPCC